MSQYYVYTDSSSRLGFTDQMFIFVENTKFNA